MDFDPARYPPAVEANFDGLVGPTHNYAGLAPGNLASARNAATLSNPRAAALQGLAKMRVLMALGIPQAVLPPHERPHLPTLKALGFRGRDAETLKCVARDAPELLAAASSASAMWTANAASVSASADSADRRVHFTPANLASHLHRAIEPQTTARVLATVFGHRDHFVHHAPLPATPALGDEGAANQMRFCAAHGTPGVSLFVYGREAEPGHDPSADDAGGAPLRHPARQSRAASAAIARLHELADADVLLARQAPAAIDAGVFHNDVIAVSHRHLLLAHETAFADADAVQRWLAARLQGVAPVVVRVREAELPLAEAVDGYLFNAQLVTLPDGRVWMIAPQDCAERPRSAKLIERLLDDRRIPVDGVTFVDLRQSLRNGGGPACLRLRVVLTEAERAAVHERIWLTEERATQLEAWIVRHYRDRLAPADLADPQLLDESRTALDALTQLLGLGSLYDFQR